MPVETEHFRF